MRRQALRAFSWPISFSANCSMPAKSVGTAMHMVGSCAIHCSQTRLGVIGAALTRVGAQARSVK
jgi:hypothetical protein